MEPFATAPWGARGAPHMTLSSTIGLAALSLLALAACEPHVSGNGVLGQAGCDAGLFDTAKIGLGMTATLTVDATKSASTCVISGDENLIQHIQVLHTGNTVETHTDLASFDHVLPLELRITTPVLVKVETQPGKSGETTRVVVNGAATQDFTVVEQGPSSVWLSGAGGSTLTADLSAGSMLDARDYLVGSAQVALTGGSSLHVETAGAITGSAADNSVILVHGGGSCSVTRTNGATCGAAPP
ncbi:MAG TPA: DUF2807 domain-containing protein [Anaeromyxobacteraceae bacterium]|nr:DUF2807 domain-containing protein [Anaeromyxobacteraceae bacterium]